MRPGRNRLLAGRLFCVPRRAVSTKKRFQAAPETGPVCGVFLLTFDRSLTYCRAERLYRTAIGATVNPDPTKLLQGTLDLMILKALALEQRHGLGVSRRIEQITRGTFQVKPGSLFPALHRMEEEGWLVSSWGESENNRRAKYYRLTKAGRRQLETETEKWGRISVAIARTLEAS